MILLLLSMLLSVVLDGRGREVGYRSVGVLLLLLLVVIVGVLLRRLVRILLIKALVGAGLVLVPWLICLLVRFQTVIILTVVKSCLKAIS